MSIEEALTLLRSVGEIKAENGSIRARIPQKQTPELMTALRTLRDQKAEALAILEAESNSGNQVAGDTHIGNNDEPLNLLLKGRAVELWSDALGERLWIVADEEDAITLGEPRGSIYTAAEVRSIVCIRDRKTITEIHTWKKAFSATLRGSEHD